MARHPLDGAFERVHRAGEHIAELERVNRAFGKAYNDLSVAYYESDPPHRLRCDIPMRNGPVLSHRLGILIGEVAYNLRSALDYLVFELAKLGSNGVEQQNTQFPICDSPQQFKKDSGFRLNGVLPKHVTFIEKLQPCNGCNWTKLLREISNPDKHRKLTGAGSGGQFWAQPVNYRPVPAGHISRIHTTKHYPSGLEVEVQVISTNDIHIPTSPKPGLQVGVPAIELLKELQAQVAQTLVDFKPEF